MLPSLRAGCKSWLSTSGFRSGEALFCRRGEWPSCLDAYWAKVGLTWSWGRCVLSNVDLCLSGDWCSLLFDLLCSLFVSAIESAAFWVLIPPPWRVDFGLNLNHRVFSILSYRSVLAVLLSWFLDLILAWDLFGSKASLRVWAVLLSSVSCCSFWFILFRRADSRLTVLCLRGLCCFLRKPGSWVLLAIFMFRLGLFRIIFLKYYMNFKLI